MRKLFHCSSCVKIVEMRKILKWWLAEIAEERKRENCVRGSCECKRGWKLPHTHTRRIFIIKISHARVIINFCTQKCFSFSFVFNVIFSPFLVLGDAGENEQFSLGERKGGKEISVHFHCERRASREIGIQWEIIKTILRVFMLESGENRNGGKRNENEFSPEKKNCWSFIIFYSILAGFCF